MIALKEILKNSAAVCAALTAMVLIITLVPNAIVIASTERYIVDRNQTNKLDGKFDCILVLGAGVYSDGTPTPMLKDRLTVACEAYELGLSDKIIMSGDHVDDSYNEPAAMKRFAIEQGIDSKVVFLDHAGISTYDSIYRAIKIFGAKKILVVTQKYHLHRAIYIARSLGAEAYGVSANLRSYVKQPIYTTREWGARIKDSLLSIFKPKAKVMGDAIDLSGNGDLTD